MVVEIGWTGRVIAVVAIMSVGRVAATAVVMGMMASFGLMNKGRCRIGFSHTRHSGEVAAARPVTVR